jgi:uncharacterized membrane protein
MKRRDHRSDIAALEHRMSTDEAGSSVAAQSFTRSLLAIGHARVLALSARYVRRLAMSNTSAAVATYATHDEADAAIRSLQKSGFDMKKLSIVGKDYHTEEHAVGYYNTGDRVKFWGKTGAFWGGLVGILFSSAFLLIPVVGHIIVLGPLVSSIIGGLEGAAVVGGTSALFAALAGLGIPKDSVIQYENDVKAGKFLVIAQGTPEEVRRAKEILGASKTTTVALHST